MYALLLICAMAIGQDAKAQELVGLGMKGTVTLDVPPEKLEEFGRAVRAANFEKRVQIKDGKVTIENPLATELDRLHQIEEQLYLPPLERVARPFAVKPDKFEEFETLVAKHFRRGSGSSTNNLIGTAIIYSTVTALEAIEKEAKEQNLLSTERQFKTFPIKHADASHLRYRLLKFWNEGVHAFDDVPTNTLFVHGAPIDLDKIEAMIGNWDQSTGAKMVVKSIPLAVKKLGEVQWYVEHLGLKGVRLGYDNSEKAVVISATQDEVSVLEKSLKENGLLPGNTAVKTFRLKYAAAADLAETLKTSAPPGIKISANTELNSISVSGAQEDISAAEALITKLDQFDPSNFFGDRIELKADLWSQVIKATSEMAISGLDGKTVRFQRDKEGDREFLRVANVDAAAFEKVRTKLRELDLIKQDAKPSPTPSGSPFDEIIEIVDTTTDNFSAIKSVFNTEIHRVQLEPGEKGKLKVQGRRSDVESAIKLLTERGFVAASQEVRIFRLQHVTAADLAATLNQLGIKDAKIVPDAQANSLVVTSTSKDIELIEALIANLDVEKTPKEKSEAPKTSDPPKKDLQTHVYRLVNAPASEVSKFLGRMKLEGVRITADERTNSLVIEATANDLKMIVRMMPALDAKKANAEDASIAAPDPALGTLWTEFAKAEAKSIATAGELRTAASKLGAQHPALLELRKKLETDVKAAFTLRHRLQQAEAAQLRQQLTEIESRLTKREKNKAAIIAARVDSLLKMDELGWEAMTRPKTPILDAAVAKSSTENGSLLGAEKPQQLPPGPGANKEMLEAWERVDREEYISAKTVPNFGGMGGVGGMGGGMGGMQMAAPAPPSRVEQHGVLICGNAMIRDGYYSHGDQVVWIGDKQLPCRLAAVAPFSIYAFRSSRFPSLGITDFTHEPKDGEQVWAFIPDRMETLVKGKAFRKSGPEFAIAEETSFGIEAEGKLQPGYLVCNDQGDFLGLVSYQNGSLGNCWSAKAIGDWLQRTNMEAPDPKDPLEGRVIIALPGSAYLPVLPAGKEVGGPPGGGYEPIKPGRAFYGAVVKGVIVTHPEVSKFDVLNTGKILYGAGSTLTCEKTKLSEDGRFTLIWCKELTPKSGFTSDHDMVRGREFAIPLGMRAHNIHTYTGESETTVVIEPFEDQIDSFETARHSQSVVSQADDKGFEIEWLGSFNSVGLPVVTTGGHFLGVIDSDKDLSIKTNEELKNAYQHHKVHAISGDEILRLVEEETKKLKDSGGLATRPGASPLMDAAASSSKRVGPVTNRLKEPDATIPVMYDEVDRKDSKKTINRFQGTIVNGSILLPHLILETPGGEEFIKVGAKRLPQRLAGVTPGGLYIYHRDRLPLGYSKKASAPTAGNRVWMLALDGLGGISTTGANVFTPSESNKDLKANAKFEFAIESDSSVQVGMTVVSDDGEFLGVVTKTKGSLAVCETAASILDCLNRIKVAAPKPANPYTAMVEIRIPDKKVWRGVNLNGVLVTDPEVLDHDFSTFKVSAVNYAAGAGLTKRHGLKVADNRLALIWCDEIKPEGGIRDIRTEVAVDDFVFAYNYHSSGWGQFAMGGMGAPSGLGGLESMGIASASPQEQRPYLFENRKQILPNGSPQVALRVHEVNANEFKAYLLQDYGLIGDAVFDPGLHFVGVNVADELRAKNEYPNATVVLKASEILRIVEEESKKLPADNPKLRTRNVIPKSELVSPADPIDNATQAKYWKRLEALDFISASVHDHSAPEGPLVWRGAIIDGYAFVPACPLEDSVVSVGGKEIASRLAGNAPLDLRVFQSDSFLKPGPKNLDRLPMEAEPVWLFAPGQKETLVLGKTTLRSNDWIKIGKNLEFAVSTKNAVEPGFVVCASDGEFLGIVAEKTTSSSCKCISGPVLRDWIKTNRLDAPNPRAPEGALANLSHPKLKFPVTAIVVKGVVVTQAIPAGTEPSKISITPYKSDKPWTTRHYQNSPNGKLALVWCNELSERDGLQEATVQLHGGDLVRSYFAPPGFAKEQDQSSVKGQHQLLLRLLYKTESTIEFDDRVGPVSGSMLTTLGGHWIGMLGHQSLEEVNEQRKYRSYSITAPEILRLIEEESKKLPPASAPEKPAEPNTPKPAAGATDLPGPPPAATSIAP
jgi:hypothetical protein